MRVPMLTTIVWIGRYRRMSKDYECLITSSEAMIMLTMIRLMPTQLAKPKQKKGTRTIKKAA